MDSYKNMKIKCFNQGQYQSFSSYTDISSFKDTTQQSAIRMNDPDVVANPIPFSALAQRPKRPLD